MKYHALASSILLLLSQSAQSDSFKNMLKESLNQALKEAPTTQQTNPSQQPNSENDTPPVTQKNAAPPVQELPSNKPELSAEDSALMNQGMWRDPKTNLTWQRCGLGQSWNGTQCGGEPTDYLWMDAVMFVKGLSLAGKNDWRIPTQAELLTVFRCDDYDPQKAKPDDDGCALEKPIYTEDGRSITRRTPKFNQQVFPINQLSEDDQRLSRYKDYGYWTANVIGDPEALIRIYATTGAISLSQHEELARTVAFRGHIGHPNHGGIWCGSGNTRIEKALRATANSSPPNFGGYVGYKLLLVRGGQSSDGFKTAVNIVQAQLDAMQREKQTREALAEKRRQEDMAANAARGRQNQLNLELAAQAEKAYQLKAVEFRKKVKAGDRTINGLVLTVKGELVKVQRYARQCVTTYGVTCIRYDNVVVGEEWQRRSEILPPRS